MRIFQFFGRSSVSIPHDVRHRLQEAGARQMFERRPVTEQKRNLQWIGKAQDEAARRERIDRLIDSLKRESQYQTSRWTYGFGGRRTSA